MKGRACWLASGGQVKGRAADANDAGLPRGVRYKGGRLMLMMLACLGQSSKRAGG